MEGVLGEGGEIIGVDAKHITSEREGSSAKGAFVHEEIGLNVESSKKGGREDLDALRTSRNQGGAVKRRRSDDLGGVIPHKEQTRGEGKHRKRGERSG